MNDHYLNLDNAYNESGIENEEDNIDNVADDADDLSWSSEVSLTTSIPTFRSSADEDEEDIKLPTSS